MGGRCHYHYDEQIFAEERGEKVKQNCLRAVERGRTHKAKATRNSISWVAMVKSEPGLLPRTMSESVVLLQLVSVLTSMAYTATKGHKDAQCLDCRPWP